MRGSTEEFAHPLGREIEIQLGAVLEEFGDADIAEFAAHAEVGDSESLHLARVVGVGVLLHNPPVATADEVVKLCEGGAALAVLKVFDEEKLLERSQALGERVKAGLRAIQAKHKVIGDVRGLGSMIAIELFEGGDVHKPAAELVGKIVARAREKGLILLSCGTYYNVIRFLMPVTIPDAQLEKGLAIVAECFDELA